MSFLETTEKLDGRWVVTDLYVKPTDTHQYLAANSCHPRHCKEGIFYSQALQTTRVCLSDEAFNTRTMRAEGTPRPLGLWRSQRRTTWTSQTPLPRRCPQTTRKEKHKQKNSTGGIISPKLPTSESPRRVDAFCLANYKICLYAIGVHLKTTTLLKRYCILKVLPRDICSKFGLQLP